MRGIFITLEGPEGSGKSTQAERLAGRLRERGREVVLTREPGGTATGEAIREILRHGTGSEGIVPEAEVLLFAASRSQLVRAVILPALTRGSDVVCDRFADSTTAYQGYARGMAVEKMLDINAFAVDGAVPDLTLLLDLPVEAGFRRLERRNRETCGAHDRFEREDMAFHRKVRDGYLCLAGRWPERFRRVDAAAGEDAVASAVWAAVEEVLP